MVKTSILAGVVALTALIAACSDGSEQSEPAKTAETETPEPVAGPPAADDVTTLDGTTLASLSGDAAAGKLAFAQCLACHVTDAGVNKIGPSLNGIIGRKTGSVAGFNYSPANSGAGFDWTREKLFQYLEKPQRVIPQTKMIYAGLPDAQKRADIIAYLENPA